MIDRVFWIWQNRDPETRRHTVGGLSQCLTTRRQEILPWMILLIWEDWLNRTDWEICWIRLVGRSVIHTHDRLDIYSGFELFSLTRWNWESDAQNIAPNLS